MPTRSALGGTRTARDHRGSQSGELLSFLKSYAPFSDASAPLKTYVTKIINAAGASGAAMNPMLKAQMLATALDVFFSNPALGGNKLDAPAPSAACRST